ncbi:MAG: anti-sigma factor [Bosea sp. (in: a-proteobacteria)]
MSTVDWTNLSKSERDALAGEYVFGLLDEAQAEQVEQRMTGDAPLAEAVESWRRHMAEIDWQSKSLPPDPALWARIMGNLGAQVAPVQAHAPRRVAVQPTITSRFSEWWSSLFVWRGMAFAGALASLALAVGLNGAVQQARRQPVLVAVLMTDGNAAAAVVNTFADGRTELLPLQNFTVPEGKALEIWTLWDRGVGPRSVGLIDRARSTRLRLDQLPLGQGQLFEITLEPATGSPTGRPTGPILAKGLTTQAL